MPTPDSVDDIPSSFEVPNPSCGAGDYWPGEAENLLLGIAEEARQAGKRAGKAPGCKPTAANRGKATKVLVCFALSFLFCVRADGSAPRARGLERAQQLRMSVPHLV